MWDDCLITQHKQKTTQLTKKYIKVCFLINSSREQCSPRSRIAYPAFTVICLLSQPPTMICCYYLKRHFNSLLKGKESEKPGSLPVCTNSLSWAQRQQCIYRICTHSTISASASPHPAALQGAAIVRLKFPTRHPTSTSGILFINCNHTGHNLTP